MTVRILAPDFGFAALAARLGAEGWRREDLPGLLPPLVEGEPELVRFAKGGAVLDYSFNPAVGLRVLTGPAPDGLPELEPSAIAAMIASGQEERVLCGVLAAAELGLRGLHGAVLDAAGRAGITRPLLLHAAARLVPAQPSPLLDKAEARRALRWRIAHDPAHAAIEAALAGPDPELALTAAIGAARLGLTRLRPALAAARCHGKGDDRRARELALAIQRASLATLDGGRPGAEEVPRNRLWRAVLGQGGVDGIAMAVAAYIDPLPDLSDAAAAGPAPDGIRARRVGVRLHWLGHDQADGLPNPVRRWAPAHSYRIMVHPLPGPGVTEGELPHLLQGWQAAGWRLPEPDEWEAAMRSPDGRARPWGNARRPEGVPALSPYGIAPPEPGQGEWTSDADGLVICGMDRSGLCAFRIRPAPSARYRLRLVAAA